MTHFALVVNYQYHENYGDEQKPYWKAKGSHEELVCSVSLEMFNSILKSEQSIKDAMIDIIDQTELGFMYYTPFVQYEMMTFDLVSLSDELVEEVYDFLKQFRSDELADAGWVQFKWSCNGRSEFAFNWAMEQLLAAGRVHYDANKAIYNRTLALN